MADSCLSHCNIIVQFGESAQEAANGKNRVESRWALLHDAVYSRPERSNVGLRNAVTIGHSELRHFIQDRAGERSLRLLRRHRATPHRAANDRFVSRHRRLHQAASCIARFMRPSSAATGINGSDGRVTLTRCVGPAPCLRILSGWDQDLRRRTRSMSFNRGIDR